MTTEDGTHSGSRNVVGKFTLHTVGNPQNQQSGKCNFKRELMPLVPASQGCHFIQ